MILFFFHCDNLQKKSDPSAYEESSSLRTLLNKKEACLGPWVTGRCLFHAYAFCLLKLLDGDRMIFVHTTDFVDVPIILLDIPC